MSLSITLFGPKHYWWRTKRNFPRAWFYRPDDSSTGGVGFCIPGFHICFKWGMRP